MKGISGPYYKYDDGVVTLGLANQVDGSIVLDINGAGPVVLIPTKDRAKLAALISGEPLEKELDS